jgi:hypothetical protein
VGIGGSVHAGAVGGRELLWRIARSASSAVEPLVTGLWDAVAHHQWRRLWFGPCSALAVAALATVGRTATGQSFLQHAAIVRARLPWPVALARIPLSLFAPAQMLPYWGAMLEVGLVFGAGQVLLGWRRTLAIGLAGHAAATLSARAWIWVGRPVGLPERYLDLPDAGPSAAVLALVAYLAIEYRLVWLAGAVAAYEVAEIVTFNGLAQREHLVGVAVGALAALGRRRRMARTLRRRGGVSGAGYRLPAQGRAAPHGRRA